jgi:hypothetical protein
MTVRASLDISMDMEGEISRGGKHSTARKAWFAVALALVVWAVLVLSVWIVFQG